MPALLGSHLAQTGSLVSFEDSFTEDARRQGGGDDQDKFTPNPSTRGTGKPGHQKKQILFIDAAVPSCESLISGTLQGVETVVLHPREEGVGQIGAVLAGRSGLQSLHIVSHGSPGSIQLGSTKLNGDTIHTYANQLQQWAEALAGTDILIYGCSVAAGAGSAFLEELHRLTGANIAASATPTGSAAKGGDWNLEVRIGEITTGKAFEPAVLRDYTGIFNEDPLLLNPIADLSVTKNVPINYSIASAFSDPENDPIQYYATLANGNPLPTWLHFDSSTGTFSGTPGNANIGTIAVKVCATNSGGFSASGASDTFNLTVSNFAPATASPIADQTATAGTLFNFIIPGNTFSDADSDPLSYTATLANGNPLPSWLNFSNGTFSGNPGNSDAGTISVKVIASDTSNSSVSDIFNLTVQSSNPPALANLIPDQIARKGANYKFDINNIFSNGTNYSATLANGSPLPGWLSFSSYNLTFSGTPPTGETGTYSIKVSAQDGFGNPITDIFNLTVANSEPVLVNPIADQITRRGLSLSSSTNPFNFSIGNAFSDADNDQLHYTATLADGSPLPVWLSFNQDYGTFSGTPRDIDVGTISIKVTASDSPNAGAGAGVSDIFNLTVANSEPVLVNPIADQITRRGLSLSSSTNPFNFSIGSAFSDADNDQLHYTATLADGSPLPVWLSFNQDYGTFSGTPRDIDVGTISIKVTASDSPNAGAGAGVSDIFNLTVANSEPVLVNPIADQITRRGLSLSSSTNPFNFSIGSAFSDADNDQLHYTATLADGSPLPVWLSFNQDYGTFSGTPRDIDVGTISIKVTASDSPNAGAGAGVSDIFNLTVANSEPVLVNPIADQITRRGLSLSSSTNPFNFSIGSAFSDADNDQLHYTATLADGSPLPVWLSFNQDYGTFSGTPRDIDVGTISIKVTASDSPNAGAGAGVSDIFNLTVANSEPVLVNPIADQITRRGLSLSSSTNPFNFSIGSAFSDADNDQLHYTATLADGSPLPVWLSFNQDYGTFSGTPRDIDVGTISIKVTASDSPNAGAGAGVSDIFNLTVANSEPTVANPIPNQIAIVQAPFNYSIANTFSDADSDPLYYSATLADGSPLPGWLHFDSYSRSLTGTPGGGNTGTISVKVTASDSAYGPAGAGVSDTFDLTVASTAPPVVNPIADQTVKAGAPFDLSIGSAFNTSGGPLYYSATLANGNPLPYWLGFDSYTGTFHSTSNNWEGIGTTSIKVTASYGSPASPSASDIFDLTLTDSPPAVVNPIADLALKAGAPFDLSIGSAFNTSGGPLYYSATLANGNPLPYWLGFDSNTGTFHSTSNNWEGIGTTSIKVTASYGSPASPSASDIFDLTLT
ncbi:MAG: putative Ig domain-containing protein, partial [Oscillatoria princeps RMCB-10]|nr:putative Ig domain-containing protein [Oscillatoria princeps RMCB-10]